MPSPSRAPRAVPSSSPCCSVLRTVASHRVGVVAVVTGLPGVHLQDGNGPKPVAVLGIHPALMRVLAAAGIPRQGLSWDAQDACAAGVGGRTLPGLAQPLVSSWRPGALPLPPPLRHSCVRAQPPSPALLLPPCFFSNSPLPSSDPCICFPEHLGKQSTVTPFFLIKVILALCLFIDILDSSCKFLE